MSDKTFSVKLHVWRQTDANSPGKMLPRRRTGLSAKNQRMLARAVKRARQLALLPMAGTL